jgi:hypothetical protein
MKTNINLHTALRHCRTARHQHKISMEVQQRTLRRLLNSQGLEMESVTLNRWGSLMALRARIEREIKPTKDAMLAARWKLFRTKDDRPLATV